MSEELEPCPICGGPVELSGPSNPDASRDVVWPNCLDDSCPYILDGTAPSIARQAHNKLSREARVGRLVERITGGKGRHLYLHGFKDGSVVASEPMVHMPDARLDGAGDSLLAALESLAKEVGGDD